MKIDLTNVVPNRGRVIKFPAVTISQTTEDDLYSIVMEGNKVWSKLIRERLIPAYNKPAPMVTDAPADGAQLQWLIDQIDREVNDRVFYQTEKLGRWVTRVGQSNTSKTISSVKSATGVAVGDFLTLRDIRPILDNSIRVNVDLIKGLNADTKRRVEAVIFDGIAMRRNQKYITKQLALAMGISQRKARLIARDQTHKLNSLLTRLRNEQLGIEAYLWKTMMDDRVRTLHRAREGRLFKWSDPPSDGHPGYAINCFKGSTKIDLSNGCNKLYRRFYNGPLVSVMSSGGVLLEATPNHPILTGRGWVAINDLQEGDYLIKRTFNSSVIGENHNGKFETSFDDFFSSVQMTTGMVPTAGTELDFHGDGTKNDIDVVMMDRLLSDGIRTDGLNGLKEFVFSRADHNSSVSGLHTQSGFGSGFAEMILRKTSDFFMGCTRTLGTFFRRHFGHHDIVSIGTTTNDTAGSDDGFKNNITGNTEFSGNRQNAFPAFIVPFDTNVVQKKFVRGDDKTDMSAADRFGQAVFIALENQRNVFEFDSAFYHFERVINKGVSVFAGHVYNLSNDEEWYIADGFVTHNCRCHAMAVLYYKD